MFKVFEYMGYIIPTERIIGGAVYQSNPTVNYHYGDQFELLNYLKTGKSFSQTNSIIKSGKAKWKQYPLIWYVKPSMTTSTVDKDIFTLRNARIVIAINNPHLDWLNPEREKKSFIKLEPIAENLLNYFGRSQYVRFENQQSPIYSFDKVPNYSTTDGKSNEGLDIWDVIVIESNLLLNINCLKLEDYEKICDEHS